MSLEIRALPDGCRPSRRWSSAATSLIPCFSVCTKDRIDRLLAFSSQNAESKRVAHDYLDDDQNEYKSLSGFEDGLKDPKLMDRKRDEEQQAARGNRQRSGKEEEIRKDLGPDRGGL